MNWYYAQGDQRQGPVTESELDALIAAGTITESTLVWKEGMANWAPLKEARPAGTAEAGAPEGWIRCTATGRFFPPEEIVYLDGKPYSAAAKAAVLQGVMQSGVLPTSNVGRTGPAWEKRAELGFFPAIWQTVRAVLIEPDKAFSTMKREGGLGVPLGYYILLYWVGSLFNLLYIFFQLGAQTVMTHNQANPLPFALTGPIIAAYAILLPLFLVIGSFIAAGVLHLSLMICQGAKQPFEATFRTHCYVMGSVAPILVVPFCGPYIVLVWSIVSMSIGFARVHEINTGRAVLAVLLPMIVCCGGLVVVGIAAAGIAAQSGHH